MATAEQGCLQKSDAIVLIGMPGSGKSTAGALAAKNLGWSFIDTDRLIEEQQCCSLQHLVDTRGYLALRHIEEALLVTLEPRRAVVATGGSAAYSDAAMRHLRSRAAVLYLYVPFSELEHRVRDFSSRGIARRPDQSFFDLFQERSVLYNKYADITIDAAGNSPDELSERIVDAFRRHVLRPE
ncbi:MAG: shikimate kinase [Candidatus Omnitrophica bacterium]|nr:shikimate kinase [Candidatus Omnitrophota bacterium]